MRFFILMSAVLGLMLAANIGAQETPEFDAAAAQDGKSSFRTYCGSCHGKGATGDGPLAEQLKVQPANLTKLAENNDGKFPYQAVFDTIDHGRRVSGHGTVDMPAWGDAFLTTDSKDEAKARMHTLVQYVWSLNR